jgi:hypothetical protein
MTGEQILGMLPPIAARTEESLRICVRNRHRMHHGQPAAPAARFYG